MRKKVSKKYVIAILIGIVLTPSAVNQAYEMREGFYIGGEWLIVPLFILVLLVWDNFKLFVKEIQDEAWKKSN